MSCYEWESGTILLPTKEAPRVRDIVKAAAEVHRHKLYEVAQEFWKALPAGHKKDHEKYERAVRAFVYGNSVEKYNAVTQRWEKGLMDTKLPSWKGFADTEQNGLGHDVDWLLSNTSGRLQGVAPKRAQWPDIDVVITKPTGTKFSLTLGESRLAFDGRKLSWSVDENNHAREYGRSHPIAHALFQALDRVTWTRGSGGQIVGNDEYNRDSRDAGGGGNYVIDEYGPKVDRRPSQRRW